MDDLDDRDIWMQGADAPAYAAGTVGMCLIPEGAGWAEFQLEIDDMVYLARVSMALGNPRGQIRGFFDALCAGTSARMELCDEPGETVVIAQAADARGRITLECWNHHPTHAPRREVFITCPADHLSVSMFRNFDALRKPKPTPAKRPVWVLPVITAVAGLVAGVLLSNGGGWP